MIIKYKKNSEPEFLYQTAYSPKEDLLNKAKDTLSQRLFYKNPYFQIPEQKPATLSSKILYIEAGTKYDFIAENKEGIFWTLENQKGVIIHKRIFKDQNPFHLFISSQYAGRIPVQLTASNKKGDTVIFFIYATAKKLIRSSSWTKEGSTNPIKNVKPGAVFKEPVHLSMITWGLNGYEVTVTIKEVQSDDYFPEIASYKAKVENGEIKLPIKDTGRWLSFGFGFNKGSLNKEISRYFVQVHVEGENNAIPDKNQRIIHADYLYLENKIYIPKMEIPDNITPTMVKVPNDFGTQKKDPDLFYYEGSKNWGKLDKTMDEVKTILDARKEEYKTKAGSAGMQMVALMEKMSEKEIQQMYEGGDYSKFNIGTRDVLKKSTADTIVKNFYSGNGKKVSFGTDKDIAKRLHGYDKFQNYFKNNYLQMIKYVLEDSRFDIRTIEKDGIEEVFGKGYLNKKSLPSFSHKWDIYFRGPRENKYEYYGLMGGTQTVKVDLIIEETQPGLFKIDTTMYIGDWYGADFDDLNSGKSYEEIYNEVMYNFTDIGKALGAQDMVWGAMGGRIGEMMGNIKGSMPCLNAFFWLQYHYGYLPGNETKYKPFETELVYKSVNFLSINRKK